MKLLLLFVSGILIGLSAARRPELDDQWDLFKKTYNKAYEPEDEQFRRKAWEKNLVTVMRHNMGTNLMLGSRHFVLGENEYMDMPIEEFTQVMNGFKKPKNVTLSKPLDFIGYLNTDVPKSVDWIKKGYVTPIKNQGQCGSCWAFSSTGSLEGQHYKATGKLVSLSEQNLVDCSGPEGNEGCNGGWMDQAFDYIKINHGIDTEASYPYKAKDGNCKFSKSSIGATDVGFVDIPQGSEAALQMAVATHGPISVAIDASHVSFQLYKTGVYDEPTCLNGRGYLDHGVLVVGYGSLEGQDYWLVKNSWGLSWGDQGYIMMSRNKNNQCGIATQASYPQV